MHARSRVLSTITDQVRAQDVSIIIREMDHDTVCNHLTHLYLENKLYREWEGQQEGLALLFQTDEEKSWPLVEELMTKGESFYSFAVFRYIYPYVCTLRRQELIDYFLKLSSWELHRFVEALFQGDFPKDWAEARLQRIEEISEVVINRYAERKNF
jgi:hypothetical protein